MNNIYQITYTDAVNNHHTALIWASNQEQALLKMNDVYNYGNLLFIKLIKSASEYGI